MTSREKLLIGLVVVLLIAVALLWGASRRDLESISEQEESTVRPPSGDDDATKDGTSTEDVAEVGRVAPDRTALETPSAARFSVPMADRSQPLANQLEALKTRAEEGDPVAACALILDSLKCVAAATSTRYVSSIEHSVAQQSNRFGDELAVDMLAQSREKLATPGVYCDGVDVAELPSPDEAARKALPNMSVRQRVLLALAMHDGRIVRFPRNLGMPPNLGRAEEYVLPQYVADQGYDFLKQGAEAADPLALEGLMVVHLPVWSPGVRWSPGLSMPNPRLFATYALMLREVLGAAAFGDVAETVLSRVMATMSPAELKRVEANVQQGMVRWRVAAARKPLHDFGTDPQTACEG